jgi:hypothetical protein
MIDEAVAVADEYAVRAVASSKHAQAATPQPAQAAQPEIVVSDEMVAAYLKANTEYWKEADEMPQSKRNPARWRNGTPSDATRISLIAALEAARLPSVAHRGIKE